MDFSGSETTLAVDMDEITDTEMVIMIEEAFFFIITLLLIEASIFKIDPINKIL